MNTANYLLAKRADLMPHREALLDLGSGTRYTFAQLDERANRAANWLLALGVAHGDRVSLLAPNSVIYNDLLHACLKIGAVFTPLNWRLAAPELVYIVNNCTPQVLIVSPEFTAVFTTMRPAINVPHIVTCEGAELPDAITYETAISQTSAEPPAPPAPIQPDDPACILYTSGTTGRPKGALIPQRQILWNAINTVISWGLTADDVSPILTPMFHSGGLFVFLTPLHYIGGRVVIARTFDLEDSLRVIEQEACTVILGVPTIFQMWLDSAVFSEIDFSQVRWFISGGAPCPPELAQAWQKATGRTMRQGYGLTEVGTNCFTMTDEEAQTLVGSVGKPIFHSQMRLVDEAGQDVPVGEIGELIIAGPHICAGYLHNPKATAVSIQNGWFHT
ncbi:MAG: AMP-binding protein, partial [Anaerolineales bacterium]|nr:AMP-binding protein [Anaerolineales bacterium]